MIRSLVALGALLLLNVSLGAEPRRLAFERDLTVWVASLDGTGAQKIAHGVDPDIAPDAMHLAFNTISEKPGRHIAVADLATKNVTVFGKIIPSDNCYRPLWSPDGKQILFNIFVDADWQLGLIDADGREFRYLRRGATKSGPHYSACWSPDGRSIYAHDLQTLLQLDLEGNELNKWDLRPLFPAGDLTSESRLAVSPDGNTLLLEVDMHEEMNPAIWTLDLGTGKATRLTPKGLFACRGCWLGSEEILFVSRTANAKEPVFLYRMSRQGDHRKQFLRNADNPSVSR